MSDPEHAAACSAADAAARLLLELPTEKQRCWALAMVMIELQRRDAQIIALAATLIHHMMIKR